MSVPKWRVYTLCIAAIFSQLAVAATFEEALNLFNSSQYEPARIAFESFIEENSQSNQLPEARFYLANCLYLARDYTGFVEEASLFKRDYPGSPYLEGLDYQAAFIPYLENNWETARANFEQFMSDYPTSPHASVAAFHIAMSSFNSGNYSLFQQEALNYKSNYPSSAYLSNIEYHLALVPYLLFNWREAHVALEEFSNNHADTEFSMSAQYHAAIALVNLGEWQSFTTAAQNFLNQYTTSTLAPSLEYHLAMVPYQVKDWPEAIETLESFVSSNPSSLDARRAYMLLGDAWLQRSKSSADSQEMASQKANSEEWFQNFHDYVEDYRARYPTSASEASLKDIEMMEIECFYLEENYPSLIEEAGAWADRHPEDLNVQAVALLWQGIGHILAQPPDYNAAAQHLDAVMAISLERYNWVDELQTRASFWRTSVAEHQGDPLKMRQCMLRIRDQMPEGPVRTHALSQYGWILNDGEGPTPSH